MLPEIFEKKDLGEASFVLGIEIHKDKSRNLVGYLRRPTLIVSLKDLIWKVVHLVMLFLLKEVDILNPNLSIMILKEKQ